MLQGLAYMYILLDSAAAQTCQSLGNSSDPERFSTLPVVNLDADKHSSTGNNGVKDLRPIYTRYHNQQKINENSACENETADVLVTQSQTRLQDLTLNTKDQQGEFCSPNLIEDDLERDSKIIFYEDHRNTNLPTKEEHVTNVKVDKVDPNYHCENVSMKINNETNLGTIPVAVSESGDDDNDAPDLQPSTHNTDSCVKSTMLMASHFTTEGVDNNVFMYMHVHLF